MPEAGEAEFRYRVWFLKDEYLRLLGHLDTIRIIERALRQVELPLAYTEGFSKKPKLITSPPLPLGFTSRMELMDFSTLEPIDEAETLAMLKEATSPRRVFHKLRALGKDEPALSKCVHSMLVEQVFVNPARELFLDEDIFAGFVDSLEGERKRLLKGLIGWGVTDGLLKLNAEVRVNVLPLSKLTKEIASHFGADFVTGERVMLMREDGGLAF